MQIIFETYEDFNAAKELPLETIVIGDPIFERTEEGLLTGRFIVDHSFTPEQLEELAANGLQPVVENSEEIV